MAVVVLGAAFVFEMVALDAVPVARDIQLFFLPHKHVLWSSLQQGDIPLWTPLIRTGYPVLANFQSGVFYPPHWLYAVLPFLPAFNLLIVLHVALGGVGTYLLGRELEFGRVAALVAAVAFMLGGYFVSFTNLVNALQTAAWAPLMIAVLLRHADEWRTGTFLRALAVYLLAFLAGAPQTFLLASCVALAVGVTRTWDARSSERRLPQGPTRVVAAMTVLAVAVAGLAAAQLLPTLEMIGLSGRAGGLSLSEAGRYSLEPVRLVHLVLPNSFHDPVYRYGRKMQLAGGDPWLYSVYLGVVALALAWHARWDRGRGRMAILWSGLGILGVVLALGEHLPVFPWLHAHVPGLASFRYPEKFFLLTGLAVPMLAAHGTSALLWERPDPDRIDGAAALAVLSAGLAAKVGWVVWPDRLHGLLRSASPDAIALDHFPFAYVEWGGELEVVLGILAVTVVLVLLYRRGWLRTSYFVPLLLAVVVVDFWVAHRGVNPTVDPSFYRQEPALLDQLPADELRRTHRWRASPYDENIGDFYDFGLPTLSAKWFWQHSMQPATAALWGIQGHDASDAIHLESVRFHDWLLRELPPERRRRLLRLGSVSHLYAVPVDSALETAAVEEADSVPGFVHELEDPLPRAYLAHGRRFERRIDALNFVLNPETDYHRRVGLVVADSARSDATTEETAREEVRTDADTVGTGTATRADTAPGEVAGRWDTVPPDPGSAEILEDTGETVRISVRPEEPSHLVLTDTWYPGWRVYVDGEPRPLHRANYFFRAVPVRPGDEEVVFRYRPDSFRIGKIVSGASLVLLVAGLAGWRWLRREER